MLEKLTKFQTLGGPISFTPALHSVIGRPYRVVVVNGNKAKVLTRTPPRSSPTSTECWRREATEERRRPGSLRAVGVSRSFEGIQALEDVDLELGRTRSSA